mgnify:CR=1 FL=1
MLRNIAIPIEAIAAFCERHHIVRLSLFGSVLRDDFTPESDIDVLVEFDPDHIPGWEIVSMAEELEGILGRNVDFATYGGLSRHFRDRVSEQAQVIYERA